MAPDGDLSYALKLLASGRGVDEVWREADFDSRKALAEALYDLAGRVSSKHLNLIVYSDGASIGNPGEAGCGAIVMDETGQVLLEDYEYLGKATNNVAEYRGAVLALKLARRLGATRVELRVDSSLLANQIKGGYRVKSRNIAGLYRDLMESAKQFEKFEVTQIPRSDNKQADRLANLAISSRKGGETGTG